MSKEMLVIVLGVWTAVVTQLGVPSSWRLMLLFVTGVGIAIVGFLLRGESLGRRPRNDSRNPSSFVDSVQHEEKREGLNSLN